MPDKYIQAYAHGLDVFMSVISLFALIGSVTVLSVISAILSVIFWLVRIKREVYKNYQGSFKKYFMFLISNRKNEK